MPATWLMVVATFLFAAMGLGAKFASSHYSTGEMVFAGVAATLLRSRPRPTDNAGSPTSS